MLGLRSAERGPNSGPPLCHPSYTWDARHAAGTERSARFLLALARVPSHALSCATCQSSLAEIETRCGDQTGHPVRTRDPGAILCSGSDPALPAVDRLELSAGNPSDLAVDFLYPARYALGTWLTPDSVRAPRHPVKAQARPPPQPKGGVYLPCGRRPSRPDRRQSRRERADSPLCPTTESGAWGPMAARSALLWVGPLPSLGGPPLPPEGEPCTRTTKANRAAVPLDGGVP